MSTQPTGQQLEQLTDALLEAFNHDELTRLVRTNFDQSLEWFTPVAGKRDLNTITSDLVIYFASQEGGLKKLLGGAVAENPSNTDLIGLAGQWAKLDFAPLPLSEEHPSAGEISINNATTINTGGAAFVGGSVNMGDGGTFVGGDQTIHGDQVRGDKVGGDKVDGDKILANVGDNNTGIAIGKNITQHVTTGIDAAQLDAIFAGMAQAAAADLGKQAEAEKIVDALKAEAAKGDLADDGRMAGLIDDFVKLVPADVSAVVSAFGTPVLAGVAGPVTKFMVDRLTGK